MRKRCCGLVLLVGVAAAIAAALAPACGGSRFTTGSAGADAASSDAEVRDDAEAPLDSGVADGGARVPDGGARLDAGSATPCPKDPPATGGSCAPEGLECEYGSNPVPTCDTVATCQKARWSLQPPASGDDCPSTRSSQCPATFGAASLDVVVHCDPFGLVCDYPTGRCACTDSSGPVPVDASAAARWHCQDPSANCPRPRPPLGSACTTDGLSCDYGSCTVTGGTAEKCADGVWQTNSFACAL